MPLIYLSPSTQVTCGMPLSGQASPGSLWKNLWNRTSVRKNPVSRQYAVTRNLLILSGLSDIMW